MAIRSRKPTSPGRRFQTSPTSPRSPRPRPRRRCSSPQSEDRRPQRLRPQDRRATAVAATSSQYRIVDFKRIKDGVAAKVAAIEYDPNRTCRIALLHYADGEKAYILAPQGPDGRRPACRAARAPTSSPATPCRCATSRSAPTVHNVELRPGRGGKMARSAGIAVQLVAKEGDFATLRLPSTEMRRVLDRLPGHGRRGRQQPSTS